VTGVTLVTRTTAPSTGPRAGRDEAAGDRGKVDP
jgi:hypothetical protein